MTGKRSGSVDDGSEFFGNSTPMIIEGGLAAHGFVALAQYDDPAMLGNGDGVISSQDYVWRHLVLWLDSNADGVSTPNEMTPIDDSGITSLGVDPRENNRRDPAGNWLPLWDWAVADGKPKKRKMVDVFFALLE